MHQAIRRHLIITYAISLGLMTAYMSLLQPIPFASAQQLIGPVSQETTGTEYSREAHRESRSHPSIPNKILREEGRANLAPQTPSTNSKTTECFHRDRRTFSFRPLTCQLLANDPTIATKRQHDFSIQGAIIAQ